MLQRKRGRKGSIEGVVGMDSVLNRVVKEGFTEGVTSKQKHELGDPFRILGKRFLSRVTT